MKEMLLETWWEKEKMLSNQDPHHHRKTLTHSHTMTPFDAPGKQAF